METSFNSASSRSARPITAQQVSQRLRRAIIPDLGSNVLELVGAGNSYTRENSGVRIRIFNVLAFRDHVAAKQAREFFMKGMELERNGQLETEECQDAYKRAYNCLMSFSVLADQEHRFVSFDAQGRATLTCFDVECKVELGYNKEGQQVKQLNSVKPAKAEKKGEAATGFDLPADMLKQQAPANQPAANAPSVADIMNAPEPTPAPAATEQPVAATAPVVDIPDNDQTPF